MVSLMKMAGITTQTTQFFFAFLVILCALNADAFALAPARIQAPNELATFSSINSQGAAALKVIQSHRWERHKVITLQTNLVDSIQVLARQTATFALSGDVLKVQSAAGDSSIDGNEPNYKTQNFNAPIMYSRQKTKNDGTVQIAFGVRYLHDGAKNPEQSKIGIASLKNEIFSLPDSMAIANSPHLDQAVQMTQVQFIVLSWNPKSPKALHLEGIADPSGGDTFMTTYFAL